MIHKRIFSNILSLLSKSRRGVVFEGSSKENIKERILHLTETGGINSATEFLSLLDFMGQTHEKRELASSNYQSDFLSQTSHSRRISLVCDYVDKNFSNNLSLFPNIRILFGHLSLFLDSFGQIALHYLATTILFYIFTAK